MVATVPTWHDDVMAMRQECKHFQSRTYESGEVARFCVLGNAPDQPWNCPSDCVTYERRFADVGWSHGTLVEPPVGEAPGPSLEARQDVLNSAAEIVNAVAPEFFDQRRRDLEELAAPRQRRGWKFWKR